MIKLRPHHLLCILTYVGKGYSKPFTENFDAICERINQGERNVEIIKGPDDVCAPRLCDPEDTKCNGMMPGKHDAAIVLLVPPIN